MQYLASVGFEVARRGRTRTAWTCSTTQGGFRVLAKSGVSMGNPSTHEPVSSPVATSNPIRDSSTGHGHQWRQWAANRYVRGLRAGRVDMSNAKHTPGPWKVARQNRSPTTGEWMISGATPGYLAEVRDCGSGDVQANARLIAAAPELLAALQACLPHLPGEACGEHEDARAAIAKATGA